MPIFISPITSQWKLQVAIAMKAPKQQQQKNTILIEASIMYFSAIFRLRPHYGF